MSPIKLFSANRPLLVATALGMFTLLILWLGMHDFWHAYFPGQEDASLIVESMAFRPDYWFKTGYFEWFNVHPGQQPVEDYEIRPLTHLITWVLFRLFGDFWIGYSLFNALLVAILVGAVALHCMAFKKHWLVTALALVLALPLNPANTVEVLTDHSFYQVTLCSIIFIAIYRCMAVGHWHRAALLCILAVALKESAWFYPGIFVLAALGDMQSKGLSGWWRSSAALASTYAVALSALVFWLLHPRDMLSGNVSVFSIGMKDDGLVQTIINGFALLPLYGGDASFTRLWHLDMLPVFGLLAMMALPLLWSTPSRLPLCFLWPAYAAGILFHEELRWTHEFTLAWITLALSLPTRLSAAMLLMTCLGWPGSAIERLNREVTDTSAYGFYTRDYRKTFTTADVLVREAHALDLNTLLVANDPLRMNGDYFSALARVPVNWVTLNSIDYPNDQSAPREFPIIQGQVMGLRNAGNMGFVGFQGKKNEGWIDYKQFGEDARVLHEFLPLKSEFPKGVVDFSRLGNTSLIRFNGHFRDGVGVAYFWRDSKDAWLFWHEGVRLNVRLISPYATWVDGHYDINMPLPDCERYQARIERSEGVRAEIDACKLTGVLQNGSFLSIQLMDGEKLHWAYLLRTP